VTDIEKSSFNHLVFTTSGGMAPACNRVSERLAEKIAEKCREPYAFVMTYIRTKLRFAPLLQYEAFDASGVMFTSKISQTLTSV